MKFKKFMPKTRVFAGLCSKCGLLKGKGRTGNICHNMGKKAAEVPVLFSCPNFEEKVKAKPRPLEHGIQVAFMNWCAAHSAKYPALQLIHAIPNGGQRNVVVARKLKAEGVKRGVPDIHLPVARGGKHGLWIEMKSKDGSLSAEQTNWGQRLILEGHYVALCRSVDEAIKVTLEYLNS